MEREAKYRITKPLKAKAIEALDLAPYALGARVTARYGNRLQVKEVLAQSSFYSVNDRRLHFGLGAASAATGSPARRTAVSPANISSGSSRNTACPLANSKTKPWASCC